MCIRTLPYIYWTSGKKKFKIEFQIQKEKKIRVKSNGVKNTQRTRAFIYNRWPTPPTPRPAKLGGRFMTMCSSNLTRDKSWKQSLLRLEPCVTFSTSIFTLLSLRKMNLLSVTNKQTPTEAYSQSSSKPEHLVTLHDLIWRESVRIHSDIILDNSTWFWRDACDNNLLLF